MYTNPTAEVAGWWAGKCLFFLLPILIAYKRHVRPIGAFLALGAFGFFIQDAKAVGGVLAFVTWLIAILWASKGDA